MSRSNDGHRLQMAHSLTTGNVAPPETDKWRAIEQERGASLPERQLNPNSAHERQKAQAIRRAKKRARKVARKRAKLAVSAP